MAKLILNGVTKRFSPEAPPAVDCVSLELKPGAFLALPVSYTHLTLPTKRIV